MGEVRKDRVPMELYFFDDIVPLSLGRHRALPQHATPVRSSCRAPVKLSLLSDSNMFPLRLTLLEADS